MCGDKVRRIPIAYAHAVGKEIKLQGHVWRQEFLSALQWGDQGIHSLASSLGIIDSSSGELTAKVR